MLRCVSGSLIWVPWHRQSLVSACRVSRSWLSTPPLCRVPMPSPPGLRGGGHALVGAFLWASMMMTPYTNGPYSGPHGRLRLLLTHCSGALVLGHGARWLTPLWASHRRARPLDAAVSLPPDGTRPGQDRQAGPRLERPWWDCRLASSRRPPWGSTRRRHGVEAPLARGGVGSSPGPTGPGCETLWACRVLARPGPPSGAGPGAGKLPG